MRELEMNARGILLCVSGPSGVGKGTVIDAVCKKSPKLCHSVSVTTRAPRRGEIEGQSYYFRTVESFESMLKAGEILEHDQYCGNYYGTPKQPIEAKLSAGMDVVMDVTVPGSLATISNFPEAVSVFLLPPSLTELKNRLTKRGTEDEATVAKRMHKAYEEISMSSKFRYVIVNHDVKTTAEKLLSIIDAEKQKYERMAGIEEIIINR